MKVKPTQKKVLAAIDAKVLARLKEHALVRGVRLQDFYDTVLKAGLDALAKNGSKK